MVGKESLTGVCSACTWYLGRALCTWSGVWSVGRGGRVVFALGRVLDSVGCGRCRCLCACMRACAGACVCVHVCCACCICACMRACAYLCERPRVVCPWMVALAGGGALGFPVGDMSAIEEAEGEEGEGEDEAHDDLAAFDAMRLGECAGEQLHRPRQGPWGWGCRAAPCVALIVAWGAGGCRVEGSLVPRGVCQGCCCPHRVLVRRASVCAPTDHPLMHPPPVPWG